MQAVLTGERETRVPAGRAVPALLLRRRHLRGPGERLAQAHRRAGGPHRQHRRAAGGRGLRPPAPQRAVRARPRLVGAALRRLPAGGDVPRQPREDAAVLVDAAAAPAPVRLARRGHRLVARPCATPRRLRSPARTGSSRRASTTRCSARRAERAPGPLRVVFSAGVERRKGLRRAAARAAPASATSTPDAVVDVCGGDLQERRYARLVPPALAGPRPLPRAPAARRGGRRCCAARRRLLRAVVRPRDGRASSLLEAMASGAAVVASQIPGYDEVVHDEGTALLVPPRDVPRARGGALAACSTTPSCGTGSSAHALRVSRRYDWERVDRRDRRGVRRGGDAGGGTRCRAAAASSASCSPTSTSTRTTARTA